MKTRIFCTIVLVCAALAGCSTTREISSDTKGPISAVLASAPDSTIATGLQNAAWNFDQAVAIGVLSKDDPAPACLHGVLQQVGLEQVAGAAPTQSFTPKVTDLISAGSVLYIKAKQARAAGPNDPPAGCDALVGAVVRDALRAGFTAASTSVPGVGPLLNAIRR